MIRSLFLVSFFLISCNDYFSEKAISKDFDFNIMVNDYKLVDSDSLQVKLSYHNPDLRNIPVSIDADSVLIDLKQDGLSINSFFMKVEPRNQQRVIILNDNESSFASLLDNNR